MAWWEGVVGYEVYLRSFVDSDGDGVGDLPGLTSRLDHLAALGVDVVWVTPCYPSPGHDHGYDVSDYTDVADVFGGMPACDELLREAHARGLRVILDLVPNHTSNEHPWFREALADPTGERRDWYVWRDGRGDDGERPPNNWISHFGGPAWTRDANSGQWYLHLFLPEQPDLNWEHPGVRDAFDDILRFWFSRGVDGMRIDVAHALMKAPGLPDNPWSDVPEVDNPLDLFMMLDHPHDLDQATVQSIYGRWHDVAAEFDAHLVGEVYLLDAEKLTPYVADGRLHSCFYFPALRTTWDADEIRAMVHAGVTHGRGRLSWPLASHDDARAATRFGGGEVGTARQLAFMALLAAMPGIPYLYQGEEFGLSNGTLPPGTAQDPVAVNNPGAQGRDGSRTPITWDDTPGRGFTTGEPWLPFGTNHDTTATLTTQRGDPSSPLQVTRRLLATRRRQTTMLAANDVVWLGSDHIVALRRGNVVVACNVGGPPTPLEVDVGNVIFTSAAVAPSDTLVPTDTTVWWEAR